MGPVWIADDSIASAGLYDAGRLAFYGSDGIFGRSIGPDPAGEPEVPINVRQHAYEAEVQTNSDGSRIAIASINADQLEIYNANNLLRLVRGPYFHDPQYTVHGNDEGASWPSIDDETVQGYVDITATDDLVFALYSGVESGFYRNRGWWSPPARTVIAFTWTGQPQAVLDIQNGALRIGISADGKNLLAIYHTPVPMILRYDVPDL